MGLKWFANRLNLFESTFQQRPNSFLRSDIVLILFSSPTCIRVSTNDFNLLQRFFLSFPISPSLLLLTFILHFLSLSSLPPLDPPAPFFPVQTDSVWWSDDKNSFTSSPLQWIFPERLCHSKLFSGEIEKSSLFLRSRFFVSECQSCLETDVFQTIFVLHKV